MSWKEKYLIVFVALIGLSFLFFITSSRMVKSETSKINKIEKKIKAKQEQLNSAEVLNEELSGVRDVIVNSITKDKDEKSFSAEDCNQMVRFLQNTADSLHIAVTALDHQEKFSPGKSIEHQYTISLTCTYLQLGQYIATLEKTDRILRINSLDVNPVREDTKNTQQAISSETRYRVVLELSAFKVKRDFGQANEVTSSTKKDRQKASAEDQLENTSTSTTTSPDGK